VAQNINNPETLNPEILYKHSSLPYDLVGDNLKHDLSSIFDKIIRNVDEIAPAASTKVSGIRQ